MVLVFSGGWLTGLLLVSYQVGPRYVVVLLGHFNWPEQPLCGTGGWPDGRQLMTTPPTKENTNNTREQPLLQSSVIPIAIEK